MRYLFIKVHEIYTDDVPVLKSRVNILIGDAFTQEMDYVAPEGEFDTYGEDVEVTSVEALENQMVELKFEEISTEFNVKLNVFQESELVAYNLAGIDGKYRACVEIFTIETGDMALEASHKCMIKQCMWRVIGHRGFGANRLIHANTLQVEENTRLSISSAFYFGLKAVEVDVQRLFDGSLIVYHDEDLLVHGVKIPMSSLDLQQFLALSREFNKPGIPVVEDSAINLSEALKLISDDKGINIELKMYRKRGVELGLKEVHAYCQSVYGQVVESNTQNVIFSSFDITLCIMMKLVQPTFPILFIIPEFGSNFEKIEKCMQKHKLSGVVMTANQALYFGENLKRLKKMGLYCFTYQQPENTKFITKQFEYGVDGVIIDDPRRYQWLLALFE